MSLHDKESALEIEAFAPHLVKLDRSGGFRTPHAYFDDLEQAIDQQTLPVVFDDRGISADAKSSYFDALELSILAQVAAEATAHSETTRSIHRGRIVRFAAYASGIAATIAVLWFIDTQQPPPCQTFECMLSSYTLSEADLHTLEVETWEADLEDDKPSLFTHLDDEVLTAYILADDDNEWMLSELMND
jgi:hypothetical protein